MTNHLIWAAGLLGHVLLLVVLFTRKRVARFPWFTLLIFFYFLRSVGLAATLHFSGHPAHRFAILILDLTDVLLQCAVLAELAWIALRPLGGIRRFTLPLLLVGSGVLIVMRLAPAGYTSLRMDLVLLHFLLSVLMVEWAIVLAFLLAPSAAFLAQPCRGHQLRFRRLFGRPAGGRWLFHHRAGNERLRFLLLLPHLCLSANPALVGSSPFGSRNQSRLWLR